MLHFNAKRILLFHHLHNSRNTLSQLSLFELLKYSTMPPKTAKGKKRKLDDDKPGDSEGGETAGSSKPKLKAKVSVSESLSGSDFSLSTTSPTGGKPNFKIASWNVNGIRAWLDKDGLSYIKLEQPDVLCVQEIKCEKSKIPAAVKLDGYSNHWYPAETPGYSGVGMYFKDKPVSITEGIGISKHDKEGRVITAEFDAFFLVNTYIPNSGRGLPRLDYRTKEWDVDFRNYLQKLDAKKPVIWTGDLNVAHKEIDLKNHKTNHKTAGFTDEEREQFTKTLESGFIDSFRVLHPDDVGYSFWPYIGNCRAKNAGWRLDYFVVSERFKKHLCDSVIREKVMGSDHCPVVLSLSL